MEVQLIQFEKTNFLPEMKTCVHEKYAFTFYKLTVMFEKVVDGLR
jgi:hypothetical protein